MKRKATVPVRWQPYAELTAAACGGEGSIHTSLLGGGRGSGIVERNLLSQFKGDAKLQVTDDRPKPSLALSLRVGAEVEPQPQPQNRVWCAPTGHSPSLLPAGSGVPVPPQTYAPGSAPTGAGLAPSLPLQLGSNSSIQLPLGVGATTPEPGRGACVHDSLAADLLKMVSEELDRRMGLLRQELSAEIRKEVLRLQHGAAAGVPGVPHPAAAFSAAGLPQLCGGAWHRCPACGARPGMLTLTPYEHLCLCAPCSADATRLCVVCSFFTWTGAVEAASRGRERGRGRGRESSLPPWA